MPRPRILLTTYIALALATLAPAMAQDILRGHGGPVRTLGLMNDKRQLVSGSFDTAVIVWNLQTDRALRVLRFHDGSVNAVAIIDSNCFATAGDDKRIAVWCGESEKPTRNLEGHGAPVTSLVMLDKGGYLASGSFDGTVRLWSVPLGRLERTIANHKSPVTALAGTPDGRGVISAGFDGLIQHTRIGADAGPSPIRLDGPVTALAIAPDGEIIAASSDGHVRFVASGFGDRPPRFPEIEVDASPLASLAVSPDGKLIATAGLKGGVAVIDRASRKITARLTGPGLPVWSLAFDADNRTLLTGGADRVIRRWDAVVGKALTSTVPEPAEIAAASGERGARVFRACQACHTLTPDGGNRAGPTLHGVFGRRIATAQGYTFSESLKKLEIVWNKETIARLFEIGPAAYTPGTKMPEQTITDPADRRALVDWLEKITR